MRNKVKSFKQVTQECSDDITGFPILQATIKEFILLVEVLVFFFDLVIMPTYRLNGYFVEAEVSGHTIATYSLGLTSRWSMCALVWASVLSPQ